MQFLMIAKPKKGVPMDVLMAHIKGEVEATWRFYSENKLRQMWFLAEESGVVFLWEAESREVLEEALNQYPMKKDDLLEMEVLPLKPYLALENLFTK